MRIKGNKMYMKRALLKHICFTHAIILIYVVYVQFSIEGTYTRTIILTAADLPTVRALLQADLFRTLSSLSHVESIALKY